MARFISQQRHQGCVEETNASRVASIQVSWGLVYTTSILYQHTQHEQLNGGFETQRSVACTADAARPSQDGQQSSQQVPLRSLPHASELQHIS